MLRHGNSGPHSCKTKESHHQAYSTLPLLGSCPYGWRQPYLPAARLGAGCPDAIIRHRSQATTAQAVAAEAFVDNGVALPPATIQIPGSKLRLVHPRQRPLRADKLMVFLPGTDGTGQAILPQLPSLQAAGYDVYCLYMPPEDRSDWQQLADATTQLIAQLLASQPVGSKVKKVTLFGESFGGVVSLLVALAAPHLLEQLVLLNPATCFSESLGGLTAVVSATNLLSLFPPALYQAAQATMLPLLVDSARLGPGGEPLMRAMIEMMPAGAGPTQDMQSRLGQPMPGVSSTRSGLPRLPRALTPSDIAAAANFRANLLREGAGLTPTRLARMTTPVLLLSSARDRLFPSLQEGARLQRLLPNARRIILPDSGHAATLERGIDLVSYINRAALLRPTQLAQQPSSPTGSGLRAQKTVAAAAVAAASFSSGAARSTFTPASTGAAPKPSGEGVTGIDSADVFVPGMPSAAVVPEQGPQTGDAAAAGSSHTNGASSTSMPAEVPANGRPKAALPEAITASTTRTAGRELLANRLASRAASSPSSSSSDPPARDMNDNDGLEDTGVDSFDEWSQILAPWRDLVSPVVLGMEHLPLPGSHASERPMLFVGNHQRVGFYDTPLFVYEMAVRGYRVRGLAHPNHWSSPVGPFFQKFGAVKASPLAAYKLLKNNEKVLLFPGGAREVCKPRDANYTLLWKEEPDFVRLAAKCGALIVPFAAVGADDAYDVVMDTDEIVSHPVLGPLAKSLFNSLDPTIDVREAVMPITRLPGVGLPSPIPIPNLNRLYFKIAPPIDTRELGPKALRDKATMAELYGQVRATVEESMQELLDYRATDEGSAVGARVAGALSRFSSLITHTATSNNADSQRRP